MIVVGDYGVDVTMAPGVMSSLMSGAGYGTRLGDPPTGPILGKHGPFVMVLDIARPTDLEALEPDTDEVIAEGHDAPRAQGVERLYCAGELELETAQAYARDGIPLNDETVATMQAAAQRVGAAALI